ncbi:MAG TPA: cytochrome c peroxidase [Steroidobacteraceae bacterium]|nr:cytochrome c peroxidase [Steroidobacteraceae bacterium]
MHLRLWPLLIVLAGCGPEGERHNSAPAVRGLQALVLVQPGFPISVDVSRGISDPDGGELTFEVRLSREAHGLAVAGHRVTGVFTGVGAVRASVIATDEHGASVATEFDIVAPAAEPGRPDLPARSHVYDDFQLHLPAAYLQSRRSGAPFWDTTPESNPVTNAGATLGRVLFYDRRLSSTNTHSCGSCHLQKHGFADPRPLSVGATGEPTRRNAMGLTNVRYSLRNRYFADGRVRTLESLALLPIQDRAELANTLPNLVRKLGATDFYPPLFKAAFGTPEIDADRIGMALAQFLRSLISYRAPVDTAYPEASANFFPKPSPKFTAQQNEGLQLLIEGNCLHCHVDRVLTMVDPSNNGLDVESADAGQGGGAFRAASLRNIRRTAPYMHDGRFATLREVIDHYDHDVKPAQSLSPLLRVLNGDAPRRLNLTERQKRALEAILDAFTDEAMLEDPKFSDPFD